jgi:hypothetical protein
MKTKLIPAALFAAILSTPAMALDSDDCTQLAIAIGTLERAVGLCPADAELFEQRSDMLNSAGYKCEGYDHDAVFQAGLIGAKLVNSWKNRDGVQAVCDRLRAAILQEKGDGKMTKASP